jgi:hypothetical protein
MKNHQLLVKSCRLKNNMFFLQIQKSLANILKNNVFAANSEFNFLNTYKKLFILKPISNREQIEYIAQC